MGGHFRALRAHALCIGDSCGFIGGLAILPWGRHMPIIGFKCPEVTP